VEEPLTEKMELSEDAVTILALAGTALAYAESIDDEVERWLRALRLYGNAGIVLQAFGIDERPRSLEGSPAPADAPAETRVAAVLTAAEEFAGQRGADVVGTLELLLAVMRVYADAFDRALAARGADRVELVAQLDAAPSAVAR
jgi:hypothetical protein